MSNANNNSIKAQVSRLLLALLQRPIDTLTARKRLNIQAPAARIKELRAKGHKIITERITATDDYGRKHQRIARYTLLAINADQEVANG